MKMSKYIKQKLNENPNRFFVTHNQNAQPIAAPTGQLMKPNIPAIQNTVVPPAPVKFAPVNTLPSQIINPLQNVMPQQTTPLAPTFGQNVMNQANAANTTAHNAINTGVNYAQQAANKVMTNPTVKTGVNTATNYGSQAMNMAAAHPYAAGAAGAVAAGAGIYNYIRNKKKKKEEASST